MWAHDQGNIRTAVLLALAAVVSVLAIVAVSTSIGRPDNGPPKLPEDNGPALKDPAVEGDPQDAAASLTAWVNVPMGNVLIVRAEDCKELQGRMKLASDLDNEHVLDEDGRRATVSFVWVEDKACEEGEDPVAHNAVFELEVKQAGTYYPWARVWWTDSCGNSIALYLRPKGENSVGGRAVIRAGEAALLLELAAARGILSPRDARTWRDRLEQVPAEQATADWLLDQGPLSPAQVDKLRARRLVVTDDTHGVWHWLRLCERGSGGLALKAGACQLVVENREDGARLSRVLFTTRDYETYTPDGPEG